MKKAGDMPIKESFRKTIWMLFPRGDASKTLKFPDGQRWFALKTENISEPAVSVNHDLSNILIQEKWFLFICCQRSWEKDMGANCWTLSWVNWRTKVSRKFSFGFLKKTASQGGFMRNMDFNAPMIIWTTTSAEKTWEKFDMFINSIKARALRKFQFFGLNRKPVRELNVLRRQKSSRYEICLTRGVRLIAVGLNRSRDKYGKSKSHNTQMQIGGLHQ